MPWLAMCQLYYQLYIVLVKPIGHSDYTQAGVYITKIAANLGTVVPYQPVVSNGLILDAATTLTTALSSPETTLVSLSRLI